MPQLLNYLAAGHMIVILVNVVALQEQDGNEAFRGHYIVLTDVDKSNEMVSYLDPAFSNGTFFGCAGALVGGVTYSL